MMEKAPTTRAIVVRNGKSVLVVCLCDESKGLILERVLKIETYTKSFGNKHRERDMNRP